jgi:hypothetical protein
LTLPLCLFALFLSFYLTTSQFHDDLHQRFM